MKTKAKATVAAPPWETAESPQEIATEAVRRVASAIHARILKGEHAFGTRLPPERTIGEAFSVSRTVVRKSFELLQSYNYVSHPRGRSRYVTYRPAEELEAATPANLAGGGQAELGETTSPLELNVVRSIVEPEIVRLAIINMSARDIANLRSIVEGMSAVTTSASDFARWDERFHLALVEGARNTLLTAIYRLINDVRRHAHWNATREKTLSPNRIRDYQKLYRSICTALEARDIENAVEFVKLVMVEAQRDLTLDA